MAVWRLIAHHAHPDAQIQAFLDLGWIAIGWSGVGDLRQIRPASGAAITPLVQAAYPQLDNAHLGGPSLWRFYIEMAVGDLVIVGDGTRRRAVVRVAGDYVFRPAPRDAVLRGYGHWRAAEYVACDPEALWAGCGSGLADGENARWTLARCAGGGVPPLA